MSKYFSAVIKKSKKDILNDYYKMKPEVTIENGLRIIKPYEYVFQSYIKERWAGLNILEVLTKEFKKNNLDVYISKIEKGMIKVNGNNTDVKYKFKNNDFLSEISIRRENPIIYHEKIEFLFEDENFLVVNKPNSWPVVPNGAYQFNTLLRILMDEYNFTDLKTVHRIDKDTSGVVILAKNEKGCQIYNSNLENKNLQKVYICRVRGEFPYEIKQVNHKISENNDINNMKTAVTDFEKLYYDKETNTSILKAFPLTGRTHQIRKHLLHLKFPVANDPWYGGEIFNNCIKFDNSYCFKIWLHSLCYKFDKYNFQSLVPEWGKEDYKIPNKTF